MNDFLTRMNSAIDEKLPITWLQAIIILVVVALAIKTFAKDSFKNLV